MRNHPIEEIEPKEAANEKENSFVGILETPQISTASAVDVSIECFVALLVGENPVHSLLEATCLVCANVVNDNDMVPLLVCIAFARIMIGSYFVFFVSLFRVFPTYFFVLFLMIGMH